MNILDIQRAAETELVDDTSITDRFEVYRMKFQNLNQEKEETAYEGIEKSVAAAHYKSYKIYGNASHSGSQTLPTNGSSQNLTMFNRESIESIPNGGDSAVQYLIKDSDEQITVINRMLEEQRRKKSLKGEIQSDEDEEKLHQVYLNKKLIPIRAEKINQSLYSNPRNESLENELWTSKSAAERVIRDISDQSQNLLEFKTASIKDTSNYSGIEVQKAREAAHMEENPYQAYISPYYQQGNTTSHPSLKESNRNAFSSSKSSARNKSTAVRDDRSKSQEKVSVETRMRTQDQARAVKPISFREKNYNKNCLFAFLKRLALRIFEN